MIESRQAIIERSNELFYEAGFVGVSIEAVLEASGLSRGTFYKHFSGKHDVALAVLDYRSGEFEGALAEALADANDTRAVAAALFRVLREWQRRHGARGCLFQTAASEYGRRHADVHRIARDHKIRMRGLVEVALHRAGAADARNAADALLLLFEGAVALGQFHDPERQIDAADRAAAALLA